MSNELTIIVPTYNEEGLIQKALESLLRQKFEPDLKLEVIVVTNGCTDGTEKIVKNFIDNQTSGKIVWKHLQTKERGKARALNLGLKEIQTEIMGYIDADVILDEGTLSALFNELTGNPKLMVVGATPTPVFNGLDKNSLLRKVERLYNIRFMYGGDTIPMGRCLIFKKELVSKFPENIPAEDTWLTFHSIQKAGLYSVRVLTNKVFYTPPKNWEDWLKQRSRFAAATEQLVEDPEMKKIQEEWVGKFRKPIPDLIKSVESILKEDEISEQLVFWVKDFLQPLIVENSRLRKAELLDGAGNWEQIKSTKK